MKISSKKILTSLIFIFLTIANSFSNSSKTNEQKVLSYDTITSPTIKERYDALLPQQDFGIHLTNNYATQYFYNLKENFGNNSHGSCTFVAIAMLLSYFNTYWDSNLIDQQFIVNSKQKVGLNQNLSFDVSSPGIYSELSTDVYNLTIDEYKKYIEANKNHYFHLNLLSLSNQFFDNYLFESENNYFGLNYYQMYSFLEYYLYTYKKMSSSKFVVESNISKNISPREYAIEKIKNNIPVILRVGHKNGSKTGGHAVIAYDYSEKNDTIYVHSGWKNDQNNSSLPHMTLAKLGYDSILDATTIIPKSSHIHSSNYKVTFSDNTTKNFCSCIYDLPDSFVIENNLRDQLPSINFNKRNKNNWTNNDNSTYKLNFLNESDVSIFKTNTFSNKLTWSFTDLNDWKKILNAEKEKFKIQLITNKDDCNFVVQKTFYKPTEWKNDVIITPTDYNFEDAYPTDDKTANEYTWHEINNVKFGTKRYRTGYIHNEYIVLSPIRKDINEAYIEYHFLKPLTKLSIQLSNWRSPANEYLKKENGEAYIETYYKGEWHKELDLLNQITLSDDRNDIKTYDIEVDENNLVYTFRISAKTTLEFDQEKNKGRICIGSIQLNQSENSWSLSGSELDYNPEEWESVKTSTNCYLYGINNKHKFEEPYDFFFNPQNTSLDVRQNLSTEDLLPSNFKKILYNDSIIKNYSLREISKYDQCKYGTYKIAVYVTEPYFSKDDFHFYRQNSDGTWSYKNPSILPTNLDHYGNIITDPDKCARIIGEYNYSYLVGFFEVSQCTLDLEINKDEK